MKFGFREARKQSGIYAYLEERSPPLRDRSMLPPYSSLLNRRLIVPSDESSFIAIDRYFFTQHFKAVIAEIYVDAEWYCTTYPDIADAIRAGAVASAADHYQLFGYYEHRLPYKITVDEAWYLQEYPDIKSALLRGDYETAQQHFDEAGYKEGRFPVAGFALRSAS